jgi:protein SCO1/2
MKLHAAALAALSVCLVAPAVPTLVPRSARAEMREPLNTGMVPSTQLPRNLRNVAFDQRLGAQVPLSLQFIDELGRPVRLSDVIRDKPVILTLAYFRCPSLCTLVLNGVVDAIAGLSRVAGRDFRLVTVSINPDEGPRLALAKKRAYLARYGKVPLRDDSPAWRMLTGREPEIRRLAESVGFRYLRDARTGEFSHASGLVVLTPQGKVSQYLFGIRFKAEELDAALSRASGSRIGSAIPAILLYCFHYDPVSGSWSFRILNIMRALGILTVIVIAGLLLRAYRKDRLVRRERTA